MKEENQQNINYQNNILNKLRIEEEYQRYKTVLNKTNQLYEENNKKYFPIISTLKDCEEQRLYFLYSNFQKFISILTKQNNSLKFVVSN